MIRSILVMLAITVGLSGCAGTGGGPSPQEATLTAVGQEAPDFTLTTLENEIFTLSEMRGKVVLINWFATWCPPCKEEMPHLQKEVQEAFQDDDFVLVSVAREEGTDVVAPFVAQRGLTWTFLLDVDRTAYARYAEAFIPRNHVVDRQGKILFQSNGFEKPEFEEMIRVIRQELERGGGI